MGTEALFNEFMNSMAPPWSMIELDNFLAALAQAAVFAIQHQTVPRNPAARLVNDDCCRSL